MESENDEIKTDPTLIIGKAKHIIRDGATVLSAIRFKIDHHYKDKYPDAIRESTTLRLKEDILDLENIVDRLDKLTIKMEEANNEK